MIVNRACYSAERLGLGTRAWGKCLKKGLCHEDRVCVDVSNGLMQRITQAAYLQDLDFVNYGGCAVMN